MALLYSIQLFTQYLQQTPNIGLIFVQKTKMFDIFFFAFQLESKNSTTQIDSVHNQHESSEKTAQLAFEQEIILIHRTYKIVPFKAKHDLTRSQS